MKLCLSAKRKSRNYPNTGAIPQTHTLEPLLDQEGDTLHPPRGPPWDYSQPYFVHQFPRREEYTQTLLGDLSEIANAVAGDDDDDIDINDPFLEKLSHHLQNRTTIFTNTEDTRSYRFWRDRRLGPLADDYDEFAVSTNAFFAGCRDADTENRYTDISKFLRMWDVVWNSMSAKPS